MALATQCPHCHTTFRVASDQLKLRGGIVRCGACNEVFDGNATLIDPDAPVPNQAVLPVLAAPAPPAGQTETSAAAAPAGAPGQSASAAFDAKVAAIEALDAAGDEPIYTLDFDTTFDPFGILPKPALPQAQADAKPEFVAEPEPQFVPEPGPQSEPQPESEPDAVPAAHAATPAAPEPAPGAASAASTDVPADLVVDEEIEAIPAPEDEPAGAPVMPRNALPMRESAAGASPEPKLAQPAHPQPNKARSKPARSKGVKTHAYPPAAKSYPQAPAEAVTRDPELEDLEFMRRGRVQEKAGKTRRMLIATGSVVLALALLVQGMTTFRNVLAARFPQLKPALAFSCAPFGCRVELPTQIDTLSIETGELQTQAPATLVLTTLLRNQGDLVQAWPDIELALTDANDKPLVRRVFSPAEYLPHGASAQKGFAPRSEQAVKLYFELSQVKASGYHIAIFYP
jgi:predicted Zn finger-like uncharacterized protein